MCNETVWCNHVNLYAYIDFTGCNNCIEKAESHNREKWGKIIVYIFIMGLLLLCGE